MNHEKPKVTMTHPEWFRNPRNVYRELIKKTFFHTAGTHREPLRKILELGRALDKRNVLEIGSGPKPIAIGINPQKATLIDITPEIHAKAKETIERARQGNQSEILPAERINFIEADATVGIPHAIEREHFSTIILSEMLTHVLPEKRGEFLRMWASKTNSFMIIDRHTMNKAKLAEYPEYMDGHEIRQIVNQLGFRTEHFSTETYSWKNHEGKTDNNPFFFLIAKKI